MSFSRPFISRFAAALCAAAFLIPGPAARGQSRISERQELAEGRSAARAVESRYHVLTGTGENRRIEEIGRRLAAASARPGLDWKFFVLDGKTVNAFALPGRVYVFRGMLDLIGGDTDALAGVLAHEVAHTAARHTRKLMEGGVFVGLVRHLVYGQDDEYEADRLAVRYLRRTGYDPNGMIRLFRKVRRKDGGKHDHVGWFASHPGTLDRIAQIRRWMGKPPAASDAPRD